jgi:formylmethanofuran dehydrogenase subunit C
MNPDDKVPGNEHTFREVVEHLKKGHSIKIKGNVGHRACSSMGVNLQYFGGDGGDIEVGKVIIDGDVDSRMGISMARGSIYVKGTVKEPFGNLIAVKSDIKGYKKFKSITDVVTNGLGGEKLIGAELSGKRLNINDGSIRDTVGARLNTDAEIIHQGNVDLSTGILMRKGVVKVNGNAGKNTGALLNGGTVLINGNCDDFSAIEMKKGILVVNGDAGKFMGAQKKSGIILAKKGGPIPPTAKKTMGESEKKVLISLGVNPTGFLKFE